MSIATVHRLYIQTGYHPLEKLWWWVLATADGNPVNVGWVGSREQAQRSADEALAEYTEKLAAWPAVD